MKYRPLLFVVSGVGLVGTAAPVAVAYDLVVQSAAVDQPRINFAVARAGSPTTPLVGADIYGGETIYGQAFFDTGASGIVFDEDIADVLGIQRQVVNGQRVVFGDAAPGGIVPFNVSEPLVLRLADNWGAIDSGLMGDPQRVANLSDPANFTTAYDESFGPLRTQIGPIGGIDNPAIGDLNVIGMPAMQGKVVVMDARPTNDFKLLLDENDANDTYDVQMRTFVYDSGTLYRGGRNTFDPGIPRADVNVSLSYADFARFTTLEPGVDSGAVPPTLSDNPFIGPNPLGGGDSTDTTPPVTLSMNGLSADGSWLLDTGAAASFVSTEIAGNVGVTYDPDRPLGSDDPRLLGVSLDRQFQLQISGISGEILNVAGFFADEMLVRTDEGEAANDDDPNHLHYHGAPVLVFDIEVFDPIANESVILDGIFGMNNLVATANVIPDDMFPMFLDPTDAPFDFITFDQPRGKLGLVFEADLRIPGDANGDGQVSLADFLILRANFGGSDGVLFENGDFNEDGIVSLTDFLILRGNFGTDDGSGAIVAAMDNWAGSVPEPTALATLTLGSLCLLRRRRA